MKKLSRKCNTEKISSVSNCDVLVVHANEGLYQSGRKDYLLNQLKQNGLKLEEVVLEKENSIVSRKLTSGPYKYDDKYKVFEGYANYLKDTYNPKLIITERNGCLVAPFFKARFEGDSKSLHLPHCVLNDQTRNHSMMDYNYFPVYGPSSLNYLKTLKDGFGSCELFFGGSYLFNEDFKLPDPDKSLPVLYLGMGPQLEDKKRGIETNKIVAEWQKKTGKELIVRLHQRSKGTFWKELNQPGVTILPAESFVESAKRCSMMLSPYTNAVVDACLLRRPCQLVATPNEVDYLEVERFFGKRAVNAKEVESSINAHFANFENSLNNCDKLKDYHLSQGNQSVNYLSELIMNIINGKKVTPVSIRNYDGTFTDF